MVLQISAAIAAIAFVCLAAYVILALRKGMTTLGETNRTLAEVRNAVHGLTAEASQLIRSADSVTRDVKGKIQTIDPLLESVQDVGEVLHTVTDSVKKAVSNLEQSPPPSISQGNGPARTTGSQVRVTLK